MILYVLKVDSTGFETSNVLITGIDIHGKLQCIRVPCATELSLHVELQPGVCAEDAVLQLEADICSRVAASSRCRWIKPCDWERQEQKEDSSHTIQVNVTTDDPKAFSRIPLHSNRATYKHARLFDQHQQLMQLPATHIYNLTYGSEGPLWVNFDRSEYGTFLPISCDSPTTLCIGAWDELNNQFDSFCEWEVGTKEFTIYSEVEACIVVGCSHSYQDAEQEEGERNVCPYPKAVHIASTALDRATEPHKVRKRWTEKEDGEEELGEEQLRTFQAAVSVLLVALYKARYCGCSLQDAVFNRGNFMTELIIERNCWKGSHPFPQGVGAGTENEEFDSTALLAKRGGLTLDCTVGVFGMSSEDSCNSKGSSLHQFHTMLDIRSMYPSIICEYEIDFPQERENSNKNKCQDQDGGVLPFIMKHLLRERHISSCSWRQRAYKDMANVITGCLGSTYCRFFSPSVYNRITARGRQILKHLLDVALTQLAPAPHGRCRLGMTDSVLIGLVPVEHGGPSTPDEAKSKVDEFVSHFNSTYKYIQVKMDGLFSDVVILSKHTYATSTWGIRQNTYPPAMVGVTTNHDSATLTFFQRQFFERVMKGWHWKHVMNLVTSMSEEDTDDLRRVDQLDTWKSWAWTTAQRLRCDLNIPDDVKRHLREQSESNVVGQEEMPDLRRWAPVDAPVASFVASIDTVHLHWRCPSDGWTWQYAGAWDQWTQQDMLMCPVCSMKLDKQVVWDQLMDQLNRHDLACETYSIEVVFRLQQALNHRHDAYERGIWQLCVKWLSQFSVSLPGLVVERKQQVEEQGHNGDHVSWQIVPAAPSTFLTTKQRMKMLMRAGQIPDQPRSGYLRGVAAHPHLIDTCQRVAVPEMMRVLTFTDLEQACDDQCTIGLLPQPIPKGVKRVQTSDTLDAIHLRLNSVICTRLKGLPPPPAAAAAAAIAQETAMTLELERKKKMNQNRRMSSSSTTPIKVVRPSMKEEYSFIPAYEAIAAINSTTTEHIQHQSHMLLDRRWNLSSSLPVAPLQWHDPQQKHTPWPPSNTLVAPCLEQWLPWKGPSSDVAFAVGLDGEIDMLQIKTWLTVGSSPVHATPTPTVNEIGRPWVELTAVWVQLQHRVAGWKRILQRDSSNSRWQGQMLILRYLSRMWAKRWIQFHSTEGWEPRALFHVQLLSLGMQAIQGKDAKPLFYAFDVESCEYLVEDCFRLPPRAIASRGIRYLPHLQRMKWPIRLHGGQARVPAPAVSWLGAMLLQQLIPIALLHLHDQLHETAKRLWRMGLGWDMLQFGQSAVSHLTVHSDGFRPLLHTSRFTKNANLRTSGKKCRPQAEEMEEEEEEERFLQQEAAAAAASAAASASAAAAAAASAAASASASAAASASASAAASAAATTSEVEELDIEDLIAAAPPCMRRPLTSYTRYNERRAMFAWAAHVGIQIQQVEAQLRPVYSATYTKRGETGRTLEFHLNKKLHRSLKHSYRLVENGSLFSTGCSKLDSYGCCPFKGADTKAKQTACRAAMSSPSSSTDDEEEGTTTQTGRRRWRKWTPIIATQHGLERLGHTITM